MIDRVSKALQKFISPISSSAQSSKTEVEERPVSVESKKREHKHKEDEKEDQPDQEGSRDRPHLRVVKGTPEEPEGPELPELPKLEDKEQRVAPPEKGFSQTILQIFDRIRMGDSSTDTSGHSKYERTSSTKQARIKKGAMINRKVE